MFKIQLSVHFWVNCAFTFREIDPPEYFSAFQGKCINFTRSRSYPITRYPVYRHPSTPIYTLPHSYQRRPSDDSNLFQLPPSPTSRLPPLPPLHPSSSATLLVYTQHPDSSSFSAPPSPTGSLPPPPQAPPLCRAPPPSRPPPRPNNETRWWRRWTGRFQDGNN